MPKRTSTKLDTVQNARRVFDEAVSHVDDAPMASAAMISQVMAAMGARGGRIGGKRRLETMTDKERKEAASLAAKARWAKAKRQAKAKTK